MSQGRDLLFTLSTTGAKTGIETEIELQGDLTVNPGKQSQNTVYKNGQSAYQNNSGFGVTFEMGNSAPMKTGEALVWAAHDSGSPVYGWIRNKRTGGIEFEGFWIIAISSLRSPVNGDNAVSVSAMIDGEVERGAAA